MKFVFLFFHAIKLKLSAIYDFCAHFFVSTKYVRTQQAILSWQFSNIIWKKEQNVMTTKIKDITMHISYNSAKQNWVWQLGNEVYYERGFAESESLAKQYAFSACNQYSAYDKKYYNNVFFVDAIWKNDNNNGQTGEWGEYDFWISPIENGLLRYDIYHYASTKSVRSGVARNMEIARYACIRSVTLLKIIETNIN